MKYIIGIDSGGTKFLVKACDMEGKEIAQYVGVPAPHRYIELEEVKRRIHANIEGCIQQFGGEIEDCAYLVCGTTGIDTDNDRVVLEGIYRDSLPGLSCPMQYMNDSEVAQFAVTGGVGVVVIAGTGSIAFGRNSKGETSRTGGWPLCVFGDQGSGTWMQRKALEHLTLWFDHCVPMTPLTEILCKELNIHEPDDLIDICIEIENMRWTDPGVAKMVVRAADEGDSYALAILDGAAQLTFELADSVVRKLRLHEEPSFKVGAWGSAIVKNPRHFEGYKRRFEEKYDNVQVLIADVDAATGACRMAFQDLGIPY